MKNGMREDLLLTKRDYLLYLGIRTDEKKKKSSPDGKERNRTAGMKRKGLFFFSAFLCFALVFSVFTAFSAFAEEAPGVLASGYCGSGDRTRMTWTLTEDGELTISGTGYMWVDIYSEVAESLAETPWKPYRDSIRRLVIEEGVQTISYAAFHENVQGLYRAYRRPFPRKPQIYQLGDVYRVFLSGTRHAARER